MPSSLVNLTFRGFTPTRAAFADIRVRVVRTGEELRSNPNTLRHEVPSLCLAERLLGF